MDNKILNNCYDSFNHCKECAKRFNMPHEYCCLKECHEHEFCRNCEHGIYSKEYRDMLEETKSTKDNDKVKKIKVTDAVIVERLIFEKPYFEIKYHKVNDNDIYVGYGSYYLKNVIRWYNECFEIVEQEKPKELIKLNLNDIIKVKLTPKGINTYYHQYDEFKKQLIEDRPDMKKEFEELYKPKMPKIDKDGFTEFQLWSFINLYGDQFIFGNSETPIENLEIYIEKEM